MAFNLTGILVGLAFQILGYLLAPRPEGQEPPSKDDVETPTAERGKPIPVVFGSVTIMSPNNIGMWDKAVSERETDKK